MTWRVHLYHELIIINLEHQFIFIAPVIMTNVYMTLLQFSDISSSPPTSFYKVIIEIYNYRKKYYIPHLRNEVGVLSKNHTSECLESKT